MAKDDVVGILGAALSSVLATLGFLWNIGVLQLIFSFLAGSFTTYLVQRRLQVESEKRRIRRENAIIMRKNIYGPMFKGLSEILEYVESVQYLQQGTTGSLERVLTHYLFPTIRHDLRQKFSLILDRFEKYQSIRRATEVMIRDTLKEEIAQVHNVDIGTNENTPSISLLIGKIHVAWSPLIRILLRRLDPQQFVRIETEKWGKAQVEVSIGGKKGSLNDLQSLYKTVLHRVETEHLFQEEKEQKARLIEELADFLSQIKAFVNLA